MIVTLTLQNIIIVASAITAVGVIIKALQRYFRWFDRQGEQDRELKELREHHDKDLDELREVLSKSFSDIKHEQTILTYGTLACLKGLQEKGCNGPVTDAINKIEKYLNKKAHDEEV